jgi:hypothetical protein
MRCAAQQGKNDQPSATDAMIGKIPIAPPERDKTQTVSGALLKN